MSKESIVEKAGKIDMVLVKSYAYGSYSGAEDIKHLAIPKSFVDKFGINISLYVFELDGKHSESEAELTKFVLTLDELIKSNIDSYNNYMLVENYYYYLEEELEDLESSGDLKCHCTQDKKCALCYFKEEDIEKFLNNLLDKIVMNKEKNNITLEEDTIINNKLYLKGSMLEITSVKSSYSEEEIKILEKLIFLDNIVKSL